MKEKAFEIIICSLAIVGLALLIIAHYNPNKYWIRDCSTLCSISIVVCVFIQSVKSKDPDKKVSTKKIVLSIVAGAVLTLAVIWIVLINTVLKVGLE